MERLHVQEELVLDAFRDVFYRAYSHFLSGDAAPFELRVPPHVVSVLTEGCVADLMWVLKLRAVPCAGGESGGAGEGAMVYTIPPLHRTPLTQLGDTAANWIREHFASRWEALRRGVIAGGVPSCVPSAGAAAEQVERRVGDGQGADSRTAADATGACGGTVDPVTLRGSCERASVAVVGVGCCPLRVPGLRGMRSRGIAAAVGP
ncbi:hypothetical protein TcYC6_0108740 [Trypanosoma cruzi]|nr:hypothetical protein TcYC6_0108740 [Trypanosoma cruzi]